MKIKAADVVTIVITLVIGLTLGVLSQKYYFGSTEPTNVLPEITRKSEGNIPEEYQGQLQLFILAGQSNMSGRGEVPSSGPTTDPRVYVFGNDYHWGLAAEPIDDASNQVDVVSEDAEAGFGPALPFAAEVLARDPDAIIGLIPCATGNSSIYQWRRNLSDDTLYGSCLKRTLAASTMGHVAGILFFQGEADALDPKQNRKRTLLPDQWADNFAVLVNDWRADLNSPELPVVFAQIGTTTTPDKYPNWAMVQEQQHTVQLQFVSMITTDDLSLQDTIHFTTESYRTIGKRFAEAYFKILEDQ